MKILKYLMSFLTIYFTANMGYWSYQEYIFADYMQNIKSLGNTINIARVSIEEKNQTLERQKKSLDEEKTKLDQLLVDKKYAQYNELVTKYNQTINEYNLGVKDYKNLLDIHNQNVRIVNELIIKYGTRKYLFPINSYTPELYREMD